MVAAVLVQLEGHAGHPGAGTGSSCYSGLTCSATGRISATTPRGTASRRRPRPFQRALAAAGVGANTSATVLADGDAGLWRLQREMLPDALPVLDWWHVAVRFEHALQTTRGLRAGTTNARLVSGAVRTLERAKWRLWYGRWPGCQRKLVELLRWAEGRQVCDLAGIGRLQRHVTELLGYLERNQSALVPYAARRRCGEPISTAFVESAVNEIVAKRMNKAQQMRWNRVAGEPLPGGRTAAVDSAPRGAF